MSLINYRENLTGDKMLNLKEIKEIYLKYHGKESIWVQIVDKAIELESENNRLRFESPTLTKIGEWNSKNIEIGPVIFDEKYFRKSFSNGSPVYVSIMPKVR